MTTNRFGRFLNSAVLLLVLSTNSLRAELTVETSDAPGIARDAIYPDDFEFDLPEGTIVSLTKAPEAETHTLKGPFKGTLGQYIQFECWKKGANCGVDGSTVGRTKGLDPYEGGVRSSKIPKE